MRPLLSSSHLDKLEDLKALIKSVLIANSRERITIDQLPNLFESAAGECIPFEDFNFCSLKEFLSSISDAVRLRFDKQTNNTYVYPVESGRTKHISSLISRQKKTNRKKLESRPKLQTNYLDPILLQRLMLKLSSCSANKRCIKKHDLLSEIQAVYSLYSIRDLNTQLNGLSHFLTHNDERINLKNEAKSCQVEDFIPQKTKDRLHKLIEKYPEGIWCEQFADVYRKEYGLDLEFRDLGFSDILEFVDVLPSIFKYIKSHHRLNYKVISAKMSTDYVKNQIDFPDSAKNVTADVEDTFPAIPTHSVFRRIPKEFMNSENSVEQINVDTISDGSDIIVTEIRNPSLFWIILRRNKCKLIKLMDKLQEFYLDQDLDEYKIPPIALKSGLHVACLYSKRWHRGIIKTVNSNSSTVLFYDYGTKKTYKASNLYFLHKKFSKLPAQAIPCCLYNIKPTESKWTNVAIEKFRDRVLEEEFVVSILSRNQENNSITIDLIDTTDIEDVYITQWMVSNDLAIHGSLQIAEKDNFMIRHNNKLSCKGQRKLGLQTSLNVNKIASSEESQYTNYIRPAKKLEGLQKYKARFEISSTDSFCNSTAKKQSQPTCDLSIKEKKEDNAKKVYLIDSHSDDKSIGTNITQNSKMQKVTTKTVAETLKELEKLITFGTCKTSRGRQSTT